MVLGHTLTQNTRGLPSRSTDCTLNGTCALANRRLDLQYAFDGNGNVTTITDYTSSAKQTRGMTYDGLDRLTQTTSPTAVFNTASYSYDQLDNLLTVNVTGGNYTRNHTYVYDATSKRLSQVKNTVGGAVVANLTYDVQGNLATKGSQSYQFDLGNRLRSATGQETGYEYDGHGRRVYALTVGSSSILSQYANSGQVLYQENNKQSKRIDYIYLGNSLVAFRERPLDSSTETLKYQHTDALGSPIAVTDTAKTAIESSEYEPFGQLVNKPLFDGPSYTGHVQDAATGMTYMQQRYYDPQIGRFLSVDPVTAYEKPGQNFNRYWYANNNPYRFTDPDGRNACPGSEKGSCIQSDSFMESRSTGQTTQASESVAQTMVEQKGVVAVPKRGKVEKIGFVIPDGDGGHKVQLAGDATTSSNSTTDSATARKPPGAEAVIHGHIDGRSDGVISPGDAGPLKIGLPNGVVSEGRVGVTEIVGGRLQFRMLEGKITPYEARELQRSLNRQQRQPEFMSPEKLP